MAELGNIQVTDVERGVTPVSRNAELSALTTGLNVASKVVTEAATADLRGDLAQAQHDAVKAANAATVQPEVEQIANPSNDALISFTNQMNKHQAMAAQATGSNLRTRAILLMQQETQNAKAKYPWLRAELDREANAFMSSSPDLQALGMVDAAIAAGTAGAADSQDWIEGIKETAYGTEASGGLGIDRRTEFNTPEFAQEYNKKMGKRQKRLALEQDEALFLAQDNREARTANKLISRQLEGAEGDYTVVVDTISATLLEVHQARQLFAQGKILESELVAVEDQWQRVARPELLQMLQQARPALQDGLDQYFSGNLVNHPSYSKWQSRIDVHKRDLETIEAAILADNVNISEFIETMSLMRGHQSLEEAATLSDFVDVSNALGERAISSMTTFDLSFGSAYQSHLIGEGMRLDMPRMFPSILANDVVAKAALGNDPASIRAARDEAHERGQASAAGLPISDPDIVVAGAVTQMEKITQYNDPQVRDPKASELFIGSLNAQLQDVTRARPNYGVATEEVQAIRNALANPNMIPLIDLAGKSHSYVKEFVNKLETDYFGGIDDPEKWANSIKAKWNKDNLVSPVGILPKDLFTIDDAALEETGQVVFVVDTAVLPALSTSKSTNFFGLGGTGEDRSKAARARTVAKLQAYADELGADVTNYVRIMGLLNYAKNPLSKAPEYGAAFIEPVGLAPSLNDVLDLYRADDAL